ncbi:hypothetical protein LX32DRAFT_376482 [Colletotrichum zoysiae]|uniref:Uncharacterized protein n=1 Tax=Colletotrichum zoysiae TaxID=1216348 RepID=A0AAD9HH98_9PEZI|nr:hypothetical protein LX32DRAFT_376482 [Colletotrichum zoysiae]
MSCPLFREDEARPGAYEMNNQGQFGKVSDSLCMAPPLVDMVPGINSFFASASLAFLSRLSSLPCQLLHVVRPAERGGERGQRDEHDCLNETKTSALVSCARFLVPSFLNSRPVAFSLSLSLCVCVSLLADDTIKRQSGKRGLGLMDPDRSVSINSCSGRIRRRGEIKKGDRPLTQAGPLVFGFGLGTLHGWC